MGTRPKIIILGTGFGGVTVVRALVDKPIDVLVARRPQQLPHVCATALSSGYLSAGPE